MSRAYIETQASPSFTIPLPWIIHGRGMSFYRNSDTAMRKTDMYSRTSLMRYIHQARRICQDSITSQRPPKVTEPIRRMRPSAFSLSCNLEQHSLFRSKFCCFVNRSSSTRTFHVREAVVTYMSNKPATKVTIICTIRGCDKIFFPAFNTFCFFSN